MKIEHIIKHDGQRFNVVTTTINTNIIGDVTDNAQLQMGNATHVVTLLQYVPESETSSIYLYAMNNAHDDTTHYFVINDKMYYDENGNYKNEIIYDETDIYVSNVSIDDAIEKFKYDYE